MAPFLLTFSPPDCCTFEKSLSPSSASSNDASFRLSMNVRRSSLAVAVPATLTLSSRLYLNEPNIMSCDGGSESDTVFSTSSAPCAWSAYFWISSTRLFSADTSLNAAACLLSRCFAFC